MERRAKIMSIHTGSDANMNKRGAILHWILFGVLLALGIFLFADKTGFVSTEPVASWQLDFLTYNYLEAEKQILKTSSIAQPIGSSIALQLAGGGGFAHPSACGQIEGINVWNTKDQTCFPDEITAAQELATATLTTQMPGKKFSSLGFASTFFYGKGEKETIRTPYARYTFDNSFYVDIGYYFDEYYQIKQEAQSLLVWCKGENAAACVTEKKPAHWHYQSCDADVPIPEGTTEMVFCVQSPVKAKVNGELVRYHFGLDFGKPGELVS